MICGNVDQTAVHILTSCNLTPANIRSKLKHCILKNNDSIVSDGVIPEYDTTALLNCRRDPDFLPLCKSAIDYHPHLRRKIQLK